ncbi:hypothetical protein NTE_01489 [Candidatus Nitrososphaera evergladensis SR1]|uniref:Uncharacterized protein n=1 Tax=Candidatus Nitrososphaera evergladensis SR1 TaxID=1459636 RepID=A0A075MRV6_9ARCH|nr:hypothetical protein NTE_01489 [Candidatus Nitrososphaera evergladensis SR1]
MRCGTYDNTMYAGVPSFSIEVADYIPQYLCIGEGREESSF